MNYKVLAFSVLILICVTCLFAQDTAQSKKYLKGQLHLHTNLSDGDASPIDVAKGVYEFLED